MKRSNLLSTYASCCVIRPLRGTMEKDLTTRLINIWEQTRGKKSPLSTLIQNSNQIHGYEIKRASTPHSPRPTHTAQCGEEYAPCMRYQ
jgi:hypothetical protein